MKLSAKGLFFIQQWEGYYSKAYRDVVGVWTIGYGTIADKALGLTVRPGQTCTKQQAIDWMMLEINDKAKQMAKMIKVPLTQDQQDTLLSFVYNVGIGAFKKSTLLRLLNNGNYNSVPEQLLRYCYGDGRVIQGLLNRRQDEARLWRTGRFNAYSSFVRIKTPFTPPHTETSTLPNPVSTPDKDWPNVHPELAKRTSPTKCTSPPMERPKAFTKAVTTSNTGKTALGQWTTGIALALMAVAQQHPYVALLSFGLVLTSTYIIYRKWHDLRNYVG